jgi:hypothetical protein
MILLFLGVSYLTTIFSSVIIQSYSFALSQKILSNQFVLTALGGCVVIILVDQSNPPHTFHKASSAKEEENERKVNIIKINIFFITICIIN